MESNQRNKTLGAETTNSRHRQAIQLVISAHMGEISLPIGLEADEPFSWADAGALVLNIQRQLRANGLASSGRPALTLRRRILVLLNRKKTQMVVDLKLEKVFSSAPNATLDEAGEFARAAIA